MSKQEPIQTSNLYAIMSAIKQSADSGFDPESRDTFRPPDARWVGQSDLSSWYGNEVLRIGSAQRVPTMREQLEIMQNCLIVNHGEILQAVPQSSNSSNITKIKTKDLKIPALQGAMKTNLTISPEIGHLIEEDEQLNCVLSNIFNIIGASLDKLGSAYHTDVKYIVDNENHDWTQVKIYTTLDHVDFDTILNVWEGVSREVETFISVLKKELEGIVSPTEIDRVSDLISIEFDSGDQ